MKNQKLYMRKSATISDCGKYRYRLSRIWDDRLPKILFVMLNPSNADANRDDPTINRCIDYAFRWGFGGLMVGNLFAFRTPKPEVLYKNWNMGVDIVGGMNDFHLLEMGKNCESVLFAWGNDGGLCGRSGDLIEMFPEANALTITKAGHPGHPLYLNKSLLPINFKILKKRNK